MRVLPPLGAVAAHTAGLFVTRAQKACQLFGRTRSHRGLHDSAPHARAVLPSSLLRIQIGSPAPGLRGGLNPRPASTRDSQGRQRAGPASYPPIALFGAFLNSKPSSSCLAPPRASRAGYTKCTNGRRTSVLRGFQPPSPRGNWPRIGADFRRPHLWPPTVR